MADKSITVRENSEPGDQTFVLEDRRNEDDPRGVINITGYVFKLIVKRAFDDKDSEAFFDLTGSIVSAAKGVFKFVLAREHTFMAPETYPAEIRWWTSAPATGQLPVDSFSVDYTVDTRVRKTEP